MCSTYQQISWGTSGSPVKRLVNHPEGFKIAPLQTTLHLPADRVNCHDAPVTIRPAGASSSGQPRSWRTGPALLRTLHPFAGPRARRACAQVCSRAAGRPAARWPAATSLQWPRSPQFRFQNRRFLLIACGVHACISAVIFCILLPF